MIAFWIFFFSFFSLFGADRIGTVVAVQGEMKAVGVEERRLSKGSPVFAQETLLVAPTAKAQVKFTDGTLATLTPGTEFRVDAYRYREKRQKDQFLSQLVIGGLRLLSGGIAKKNPEEYEIKTPYATVGLRGTVVEASVIGGRVYFGVSEGKAFISNEAGGQLVGKGEEGQFAVVTGYDVLPEVSNRRPPQLRTQIFAPPPGGTDFGRPQSPTKEAQPTESPKSGATGPASGQQGGSAAEASSSASAPTSDSTSTSTSAPTSDSTSTSTSEQSEQAPATEAAPSSTSTSAPSTATGSEPSISETIDQAEFEFTPTGSGASVQGGC